MNIKNLLSILCFLFLGLLFSSALIYSASFKMADPKVNEEMGPPVSHSPPPRQIHHIIKPTRDDLNSGDKLVEEEIKKVIALSKIADAHYEKQQFEESLRIYLDISKIVQEKNLVTRMPINTRIGASYVNLAEQNRNFDYAVKAEKFFFLAINDNPDDSLAFFDMSRAYVVMSEVTHKKKYMVLARKYLKKAKEVAKKVDPDDETKVSTMICQMIEIYPALNSQE